MSVLRSEPPYDFGPESVNHSTLEYVPASGLENAVNLKDLPYSGFPHDPKVVANSNTKPNTLARRRALGMPLSTFIAAIAFTVIIIAAAVGGGVGGSMAVKNAKEYE
jgi:hypothetical protein